MSDNNIVLTKLSQVNSRDVVTQTKPPQKTTVLSVVVNFIIGKNNGLKPLNRKVFKCAADTYSASSAQNNCTEALPRWLPSGKLAYKDFRCAHFKSDLHIKCHLDKLLVCFLVRSSDGLCSIHISSSKTTECSFK